MMRLSENMKLDMALVPQTVSATNVTGPYFKLDRNRRNLFVLLIGALAATKTCKIEVLEATDAAATGAQAITNAAATVTANTKVLEATVALAASANTDVVTINGIDFTQAAATDVTAREFANAAGLVLCVNNATYGVEGVTASASGTTVTLKATDPGRQYVTTAKTENAGTVTLATTKALAYVEVETAQLSSGYSHVAAKVTSTGAGTAGVFLGRGDLRNAPEAQYAGAYAVV